MLNTYAGTWSAITLLITIVMLLYSLILMVVLLVYALMGRFSSKPLEAEAVFTLEGDDDEDEDDEDEDDAPPPAEPPPPKRRKTGLWQLLAAMLSVVPAVMALSWVDNIYGRMTLFTGGTAICLVMFAAQVFFTVWFVRVQKRWGRGE